jgi:uncharacterized membrane protein
MSLGLGIFLLVVGAILTFAVHTTVAGISLLIVGEILMGAGVLVVILGIALLFRKRRSSDTTRISNDPVNGNQTTQRERRDDVE